MLFDTVFRFSALFKSHLPFFYLFKTYRIRSKINFLSLVVLVFFLIFAPFSVSLKPMKYLFLTIFLTGSLLCAANPVDVSKARQLALQFIENKNQNDSMSKSRPSLKPKLELAYTQNGESGSVFHVFNQSLNQGYVIVAADDRSTPILGYTDKGSFDINKVPEGLRALLKSYEKQISYVVKNNVGKSRSPKERTDIEPLILTQWNQCEPYNNLCPIDPSTGERSLTGCVAVAKAQLLFYHQYPKVGCGTISYEWKGGTLTADFSNAYFEWDKMKLTYDGNTLDQDNAVANLMWYCAIESHADFGSDLTYGYYNTNGLTAYFGFKEGIKYLNRDNTSEEVFEEIIYQDLAKGLPVFYSAEDPDIYGHAFLVDGYKQGGYFHMNFGWGGDDDGFYLLSAIDLDWINFSTGHCILHNIQPNIPGKWFLQTDDGRNFEMELVGGIMPDPNNDTDLLLLDTSDNIIASGITSVSFVQTDGSLPGSKEKGDANSDGKVDDADILAIVNYIMGKPSVSFNKDAADVNNDRVVDVKDIVEIVAKIKTK